MRVEGSHQERQLREKGIYFGGADEGQRCGAAQSEARRARGVVDHGRAVA